MDIWIMLALAIVGLIDIQLERYTGRGIIARVQDALERRQGGKGAA